MSILAATLIAALAAAAPVRDIDTRAFAFSLEPERIVLGETPAVIVTVRAQKRDNTPLDVADPRLAVSIGTVSEARRVGPGQWTCTYTPPAPGPPQIAVLVAAIDTGAADAVGFTTIPLLGKGETVVKTKAGSEVRLRAGAETFGPVVADENGVARVPIALRPGVRTGTALSLDAANNTSEKLVDLRVPPFNRVALLPLDEATVSDGQGLARLVIVTVDDDGKPSSASKISAIATAGTVEVTRGIALGMREAVLKAAKTSEKKATVAVELEGAKGSSASVEIPLVPGRAAGAKISLSRDVLSESDESREVKATFRLVDAAGNTVPPQGAGVFVDVGRLAQLTRAPDGERHVTWVIPTGTGLDNARLTVHLPTGEELGHADVKISRPRRAPEGPKRPLTPRPWLLAGGGLHVGSNYGSIVALDLELSGHMRVPALDTPLYLGASASVHQQVWTARGRDHRAFPLLAEVLWRPRILDDTVDFVIGAGVGPVLSGVVPSSGGNHVIGGALAGQLILGLGFDVGPGVLDAVVRVGTSLELAGNNLDVMDGPPIGAAVGVSYRFGLW